MEVYRLQDFTVYLILVDIALAALAELPSLLLKIITVSLLLVEATLTDLTELLCLLESQSPYCWLKLF